MFRDREKALQALQEQLLKDEAEEEEFPEEEIEKDDELPQEVYDDYETDLHAYNSDTTDRDLDDYSDAVYDAPRHKGGCLLWFSLLIIAVLFAVSWYLAKQGGLL